jgi:hypothetical protein
MRPPNAQERAVCRQPALLQVEERNMGQLNRFRY